MSLERLQVTSNVKWKNKNKIQYTSYTHLLSTRKSPDLPVHAELLCQSEVVQVGLDFARGDGAVVCPRGQRGHARVRLLHQLRQTLLL